MGAAETSTMNSAHLLARTSASASLLMRNTATKRSPVVLSMSGASMGDGKDDDSLFWGKTFDRQVVNQQQAMDTYKSSLRGYQLPFSFAEESLKWPRSGRL